MKKPKIFSWGENSKMEVFRKKHDMPVPVAQSRQVLVESGSATFWIFHCFLEIS